MSGDYETSLEEFVKNIMDCHREALNNPSHTCHGIVSEYQCEPFRLRDFSRINDVRVMFLGLSPGNPELKHKPHTPNRNALSKDVMEYIQKRIWKGYDTNYRNTMRERIGSELEYVKANVVHGILDKKSAQKCLEACSSKFLLSMIGLFCGLKYVIVYDFEDKNVLDYVNKKLNVDIDFKNSTAVKGFQEETRGITFIAARRARRYIRRPSEA